MTMTAAGQSTSQPAKASPKVLSFSGIRAASALVARAVIARAFGRTFGGDRDMMAALGYPRVIQLSDYWDRYRRGGLAKRICEAYPKATWRGRFELIEDDNPEVVTEFEQAWFTLDDRLKLQANIRRTDLLKELGEYAVMLIGAPGELRQPMPTNLKPEDIAFVQPYAQKDCEIQEYETDITSPRYGQPKTYKITKQSVTSGRAIWRTESQFVDWSRVILFSEGLLDDNVHGIPRLEAVWNRLLDLDKVIGGGSESHWRAAFKGLVFNIDKDVEMDPDAETELAEQADELTHNLRRNISARGVSVSSLGTDVASFSPQAATIIEEIAGTLGMPQRILVGSERGDLASTKDQENWQGQINDRRTEYAEPFVIRQIVERFIAHGVMPEPEEWETRWPVDELDDMDRINIAKGMAEVNSKNRKVVITVNEIRDHALLLPPLEEGDDTAEPPAVVPGQPGADPDVIEREEIETEARAAKARLTAAAKAYRMKQKRARTALDKRRRWWRTRKNRKPVQKEM